VPEHTAIKSVNSLKLPEKVISTRKVQVRVRTTSFTCRIVANYANHSDIATSGAVTELRGVFLLSLTLFAGTVSGIAIPVGFFVVLFLDSMQNSSLESTIASYGTIGWVIIVEFTLFLGIFVTAIVVLISVSALTFYGFGSIAGTSGASSSFTPKGTVCSLAISIASLVFRQQVSSTCQTAVSSICLACSSGFSALLAEIVVAVGTIDLVVGELDR
jgi:hypothetical protein